MMNKIEYYKAQKRALLDVISDIKAETDWEEEKHNLVVVLIKERLADINTKIKALQV